MFDKGPRNVAALSLVAGLACWTPAESQTPAAPLPSVGAVIDETSAPGISSGAYMAGQFAVVARPDEALGQSTSNIPAEVKDELQFFRSN
jgi:hypothetical protein